MKKLLLLVLTLAATSVLAQTAAVDPAAKPQPVGQKAPASKAHILSNEEFDKLLAKPEKLLIIDVRRPDELTNIGGFPVYLSVQIGDLENSTKWIPKERSIVVVSNHAGRGAKGADILAAKGFKVLGAIGAQTYEQAGGKLTKIAAKPAANAVAATAEAK
jgi:rhodanese-related sulfurtransferase